MNSFSYPGATLDTSKAMRSGYIAGSRVSGPSTTPPDSHHGYTAMTPINKGLYHLGTAPSDPTDLVASYQFAINTHSKLNSMGLHLSDDNSDALFESASTVYVVQGHVHVTRPHEHLAYNAPKDQVTTWTTDPLGKLVSTTVFLNFE